jgi:hypothetical protein
MCVLDEWYLYHRRIFFEYHWNFLCIGYIAQNFSRNGSVLSGILHNKSKIALATISPDRDNTA